jgi:MPBQ/MSBQ methyltransferase
MAMKHHSKTYYNDILLKLAQKLFGLEYLHYGFFEAGIPLNFDGLKIAQQKYTEKIMASIPKDVNTILDVGCGAGGNAKAMVGAGYSVTCVDPDPYLLEKTRTATGGKAKTLVGLYENVTGVEAESVDLVLMSESCQYINPQEGWRLHAKHVKPGGYVMAVDFFITREIDQPYLSKSGHRLQAFIDEAKGRGFDLIAKEDITTQTAPTMDLYQELIFNKVFPVCEAVFEFVQRKFPWVYNLLAFFMREKIHFLKEKYSHQDSKTFTKYKTYFVLVFRKNTTN